MDFGLIPITALFIISLIAGTVGGVLGTYHSKKMIRAQSDFYLRNVIMSFVCALALFALSGFKTQVSLFTFLLALAFGLFTMGNTVIMSKAVNIGPWSYTLVITSSSTILTALSGAIFWHESVGALKIVGIVLMAACFALSVEKKEGEQKKASFKWLVYCILCILCSAGVGVLQKTHQSSDYRGELFIFLVLAFLFSSLFSVGAYFVSKNKENRSNGVISAVNARRANGSNPLAESGAPSSENVSECAATERIDPTLANVDDQKKRGNNILLAFALFVGIGICTAAINAINLYLSGVVESAVFFPVINGGTLMLSLISAFVVFKERLSKKQWIGLAVGIAATMCLCI